MQPPMHRTPIHDEHVRLGAKMVWFAEWDMPIQYTSIIDEHMAVRTKAGAFDVSHMGDFLIRGKGAGDLVNALCTNDVQGQPVGRCVYAHMCDDQGRILDDTIVTVLGDDEYFMVPNAATTKKMEKWVRGHMHGQELLNLSMDLACIAVQGPAAKDVMATLTSADLSSLKSFWGGFYHLDKIDSARTTSTTEMFRARTHLDEQGIAVFVSRTGYTGEDGFEIVCENADALEIWTAVIQRGARFGLKPVGLGARDTLRLEKGLLLSGTDFDGTQTSVQTGPGWVVDWKHDFVGKQAMESQKAEGKYDKLVCMLVDDRGIPRHGYDIIREGGKIGAVTSGTLSPVLKKGIAMGYVPLEQSEFGTPVAIRIRETDASAKIVKPPFVKRG